MEDEVEEYIITLHSEIAIACLLHVLKPFILSLGNSQQIPHPSY